MPTESSISARKITAAQLEEKATALRLAGMSCGAIAKQLGVNESTVWRAIQRAKKRSEKTATDTAEELRRLEDDRLNVALKAIMTMVTQGHLGAVDRYLRLSESRRKLWGLDAPAKTDLTTNGQALKLYAVVSPDDWDSG